MTRARTRADAGDDRDPTPGGRNAPIRLATADDIRKEMAKVYRQAKRGEIATEVATRLVYILGELRKAHELEVLEAQVAELEKLYGQGTVLTHPQAGHRPAPALPAPAGQPGVGRVEAG